MPKPRRRIESLPEPEALPPMIGPLPECAAFARLGEGLIQQVLTTRKIVVREDCWGFLVICAYLYNGRTVLYGLFDHDAWTPQTESILPWSRPKGVPVAVLTMDGTIHRLPFTGP